MKKYFLALSAFLISSPAFADATVVAVPVQITPQPTDPLHLILNAAIPILVAGLTALLAWLSNNLKTWISQQASKANTAESAAWYATALNLAGIAVRFAESKFGPDTGNGAEKQKEASQWLKQRLIAIDPQIVDKTPNLDLLIDGFIGAAYHDAFVAVSPLATGPAAKPSTI